ncbi:MAG: hypothetical protein HY290_22980 [Planctomycetia bacterium]|nr:hypothetical protein [Planctomycetia bacterium]
MTMVLLILAVACGAFCVWLTVRIVNRREQWTAWTVVAIAVLVYVAGLVVLMDRKLPAPLSNWID